MVMPTSRGRTAKGSIRMRCESCSVSRESWEKQHIVSRPWRMRARRGWDDCEKLVQTALTASRSSMGSESRAWGLVNKWAASTDAVRTCCSFRFMPSSAIRWCRTQSLRGGTGVGERDMGTWTTGSSTTCMASRASAEEARRGGGRVSQT